MKPSFYKSKVFRYGVKYKGQVCKNLLSTVWVITIKYLRKPKLHLLKMIKSQDRPGTQTGLLYKNLLCVSIILLTNYGKAE